MCQRRILMQWPPHYEVVVLERGDDTVAHAGGGPAPEDLRWLREIGIKWDGYYGDSAA
jgi:predicted TIM-barrel enzyme